MVQHKAILTGVAEVDGEEIVYKKVYPIAVGALDNEGDPEGKYRSVTPLYQNHILSFNSAEFARVDPWYFRAMPFLMIWLNPELSKHLRSFRDYRITKARTGIGFHRVMNFKVQKINGKTQKVPTLHRGFDSHGCIRLQIKDLYELYAILGNSKSKKWPLNFQHFLDDPADSPYPLYADVTGKVKRVAYGETTLSKVRGRKWVGAKVKIKGVRGEAVLTAINGENATYKRVDSHGLDLVEEVEVAKLYPNSVSIGDSLDFAEIMVSENQAVEWLYLGMDP